MWPILYQMQGGDNILYLEQALYFHVCVPTEISFLLLYSNSCIHLVFILPNDQAIKLSEYIC